MPISAIQGILTTIFQFRRMLSSYVCIPYVMYVLKVPSWNLAPQPNKHWLLRQIVPMDAVRINVSDIFYQRRWSVLRSVDDMVERLVDFMTKAKVWVRIRHPNSRMSHTLKGLYVNLLRDYLGYVYKERARSTIKSSTYYCMYADTHACNVLIAYIKRTTLISSTRATMATI